MTAPLTGITVFEMGSALAGPYCGRILADLGARVIKIEPPETGEAARSWGAPLKNGAGAQFHAVNRGKDSLTVDFTDPAAVARLRALMAEHGDVVVQNLRPDVSQKIGLDAAACRADAPQLIYCNISAYGPDGPLSRDPGYEALLQAFAGIMDATGEAGGDPVRVGFSVNDFGTAMWASIGILAVLAQRSQTGEGRTVDASIFDTAMGWQTMSVATLLSANQPPVRSGLRGPLLAPNRGLHCADGLLMLTAGTEAQFAKLCRAIGAEALLQDPRFQTNNDRMAHEAALTEALEDVLRQKPRQHWWQILRDAKVPAAPIQTLEEALAHEHARDAGILQNPPDDTLPTIGLPLRFDGNRPGFHRPAPALGSGTEDLTN